MPASSLPPESQDRAKRFDPLVLDRTVIAIPLLKQMEEDFARIRLVLERFPDALREFNAAIQFNPAFAGGFDRARQTLLDMLAAVDRDAETAAAKTREQATEMSRATEDRRYHALKEAIENQAVGELLNDSGYSFARLHAAVIRRLLAENERRARGGEPPLVGIHPKRFEVIIDLNLEHPRGREAARQWVFDHIEEAKRSAGVRDAGQEIHLEKDNPTSQYVFARLEARAIQALVDLDLAEAKAEAERRKRESDGPAFKSAIDWRTFRAIFHIWPDFEVSACINKSIATVKADAAQQSFSSRGAGITWAVLDSGIQHDHPHFKTWGNVDPLSPLHKDFTVDGAGPFADKNGHGTHVAGIIAGEWRVSPGTPESQRPLAISRYIKKDSDDVEYQESRLDGICGMAPQCKLVSLRVLDDDGKGSVSNLIAAIAHVQEINGYGRRLIIHGVNMSLGYNFEPEWFACGQSPLCVEVDRLAKTGVVVVVAAGNTGYGTLKSSIGSTSAGMALTINDPGNSDLAITVGSTHRDMPHVYGVSYFSSKGPTGDGRLKPDLVAPGERIISCATGTLKDEGAKGRPCDYVETSGTSMAAPHVSGVIAAFLSVRGEFIGRAERLKEIFVSTATDLRRDRYFQGAGLVDLMRAIQSV
jgi:serine protease AprX